MFSILVPTAGIKHNANVHGPLFVDIKNHTEPCYVILLPGCDCSLTRVFNYSLK